MLLLYDIAIRATSSAIKIASLWNPKARLWSEGRKSLNIPDNLKGCTWFHCASLGEFEQARPVIEALKAKKPNTKIIVSFYSPSGYELRKNYALADWIFYLPIDTKRNAKRLADKINPGIVFFVKYELWHHLLNTLKSSGSSIYLLSASFRPGHRYFKWYGGFFRKMLHEIDKIFVQDERSISLLNNYGIKHGVLTGDTRYDQVIELPSTEFKDTVLDNFCSNNTLILGSSWQQEEGLLAKSLADFSDEWKFVIAPHDISPQHINQIKTLFGEYLVSYSEIDTPEEVKGKKVLLIDSVGMLSRLYRYGSVAFIGGGFSGNLHNILEPACYGLPVCFGPNHSKFHEAADMIKNGDASVVSSAEDLVRFCTLNRDQSTLNNADFIQSRIGATNKVLALID